MKRISKIFCFSGALVLLGSLSAAAQITIFSETFGPGPLASGVVEYGYVYGDASSSSSSSSVFGNNGVGGTGSWRIVLDAPFSPPHDGFSGVGGYYKWNAVTGNTSTSLSDYTLSFDARTDVENLSLSILIRTWTGANEGGTQSGDLTTGAVNPNNQRLFSTYTHYDLNLGNTNIFSAGTVDPSGDTIRITMQLNGGGTPNYTRTLYVDNFKLTMVPEPSSLTLCAIGAVVGGIAFLRRRHA